MRSNYAELKAFKENVEKNELHSKKESLLADEKYSVLSDNEAFMELKKNMDNYSLDDLETKAKVIFADYVSSVGNFSLNSSNKNKSHGKGFDIFDSNGNYKSTYEIMQGLADLYDNIVKKDKELGTNNLNLLLETIAGKNRSNIAASILQNADMLRSVYEDAQNSEGSAEQELQKYLDSIDGKIAQLQNRVQEFWTKVIDSEVIKNGIDLLTTLVKGATDFVDTVGVLPTLITGIGAALSFKNVGGSKMYDLILF